MESCSCLLLLNGWQMWTLLSTRKKNYKISNNTMMVQFCAVRTFAEISLSYWLISACIHCRFSINSMTSHCLHSFSFNLSRIKFLVADWIRLFLLSHFSSLFPYLFYRLMRPLSKVEMRRGGSFPFLDFVSFLLLFSATSLSFDLLNVPCLLLLLLCLYFRNM